MGILIANIGTSDLAIKINVNGQELYAPIDPLSEPNQDTDKLTPEESAIWDKPQQYFKSSGLYTELGFEPDKIPTSRELTEKLLEKYQENFDYWHSRIHAPRIWGVIKQALALGINQGYIFVTDQKSEEMPEGHFKDTVFMYEILNLWFAKEQPEFELIYNPIPPEYKANKLDDLLQYYHNFFIELSFEKEKQQQQQRYPKLDEILFGKIVKFDAHNQGLFLEISGGLQGYININNISELVISPQDLRNIFKLGDVIWVKVINSDIEKLRFSSKELEETPGEITQNHQLVYNRISQAIKANTQVITQSQADQEMLLISAKGGTTQMKIALQLQGISVSAVIKILFVNPKLSHRGVLQGIPSDCEIESYWRYMWTQKYQAIKILVERWDYDGALQILKNWQDYLNFLIQQGIVGKEDIERSNDVSKLVLQVLDFARACFNLDFQSAKDLAKPKIDTTFLELSTDIFPKLQEAADKYAVYQHRLLSIYTQNRIYWQLDQVASFLAHLASFGEEVLHGLILKWEGKASYWVSKSGKKFPKNLSGPEYEAQIKSSFTIDIKQIQISRPSVWNKVVSLQSSFNPKFGSKTRDRESLTNRFIKRYFVQALVEYRNNPQEIEEWQLIMKSLQQLDFWIEQRNKLIHTATGYSKPLMVDLFNEYSPDENSNISAPCHPDEILDVMEAILKNKLVDFNTLAKLRG